MELSLSSSHDRVQTASPVQCAESQLHARENTFRSGTLASNVQYLYKVVVLRVNLTAEHQESVPEEHDVRLDPGQRLRAVALTAEGRSSARHHGRVLRAMRYDELSWAAACKVNVDQRIVRGVH